MIYILPVLFLLVNIAEYLVWSLGCRYEGLCYFFPWGFGLVTLEFILSGLLAAIILILIVRKQYLWGINQISLTVSIILFALVFILFNSPFMLVDRVRQQVKVTQDKNTQQEINQRWNAIPSDEVKFTGTIESFSGLCTVDGDCTLTVSGKVILIAQGGLSADSLQKRATQPTAQLIGLSLSELLQNHERYIGRKAEVYAKKIGDNYYSLYGSEGYYNITLIPEY